MELRVLGRIAVLHGEHEADLGARKQRLVLASLLAAPGMSRTTEQLIEDIWPQASPRQPRASLYAYISRLRRILSRAGGREFIESFGGGYRLAIEANELDATLFEAELSAALTEADDGRAIELVERALARWQGEPFADAAGEPFILGRAAHLWARRREAEEHLIELLSRAGDLTRAVVVAEDIAARETLDEAAHWLVMSTLHRAGRQAEALRHYNSTRELLVEELGVEPGAALRTLERRILEQDPSLDGEGSPRPRATARPLAKRRPIVGRDVELDLIANATEPENNRSQVILVDGEAGIGKTHLLNEVARRARVEGRWVIWVSGERGPRGAALLPLAAAVADLADAMTEHQLAAVVGPDHEALAPLLASGGFSTERREPFDVGDDMARYRMTEAVRRYLRRLASLAPVVVIVDDAQWASPAMLELLVGLTTRRIPPSVMFVIAARPQRPVEVTQALSTLRRSTNPETMELDGLDIEAVRQLVVGELGDDADVVADEIHRRTRGNPFFVSELLRVVDLADPARSLATTSMPASVSEAVLAHVAELSAEAVDLATVASLVDAPFDPILCAKVAGHGDRAADIIERMLTAGLVVEEPEGTSLSFKHDLVRSSIQAGLSRIRMSELHARIGLALVDRETSRRDVDLSNDDEATPHATAVIASHLCLGAAFGTGALGARYAITAAGESLSHYDAHEATRLATEGLHALEQPSTAEDPCLNEVPTLRAELLCVLAEALKRSFDHPQAHEAGRRAFEIAIASKLIDLAIRALRTFSDQTGDNWLSSWTHSDETIAMVEELLDVVGGLDALRAETAVGLLGPYSEAVLDQGDAAKADELTATAMTLADQTADPALVAFAAERRLAYLDLTPTTTQRSALCSRILDVYPEHPRYGPVAYRHLMVEAVEACDLATARRHASSIEGLRRDRGSELVAIEAAACRISLDLVMGRLDSATAEIEAAKERFEYLEQSRLDLFGIQEFWMLRERGELAFGEEPIRERLAQNDTPSWKAPLLLVLVNDDRLDEARELADSMAPVEYQRVFESALQLFTPAVLADTVAVLGDEEKAAWLLGVLEPMTDRLISFYAGTMMLGWASLPAGRLLGVVGRFPEAERHLEDSVERAELLGSPLLALQAQVAMAELDDRRGRDVGQRISVLASEANSFGFGGIVRWCRRLASAK